MPAMLGYVHTAKIINIINNSTYWKKRTNWQMIELSINANSFAKFPNTNKRTRFACHDCKSGYKCDVLAMKRFTGFWVPSTSWPKAAQHRICISSEKGVSCTPIWNMNIVNVNASHKDVRPSEWNWKGSELTRIMTSHTLSNHVIPT